MKSRLEKSKHELVKKYSSYQSQIENREKELKTIEEIGTRKTLDRAISITTLCYIVSIVGSFISGNVNFPLLLCGSIGAGILGTTVINKQYSKLNLSNLFKKHTLSERIEKEIENKITLEEQKNKNQALEKSIDMLDSTLQTINALGYESGLENTTESSRQTEFCELTNFYDNQIKAEAELRNVSKHKSMFEIYQGLKESARNHLKIYGLLLPTLFSYLNLFLGGIVAENIISIIVGLIAPTLISSSALGIYYYKSFKYTKKVLKDRDVNVAETVISTKKRSYACELEKEMTTKIEQLVAAELQLQEQQRIIEGLDSDVSQKCSLDSSRVQMEVLELGSDTINKEHVRTRKKDKNNGC